MVKEAFFLISKKKEILVNLKIEEELGKNAIMNKID